MPNTDTDRHSLAVLLFYSLFLGHPLEGARTEAGLRDAQWLLTHFGTAPVFCMHPDDDSNRPGDIVRQYWDIYPRFLRDLFVQAFVRGIDTPGRPGHRGPVDQGDGPAPRRHGRVRLVQHHQLLGPLRPQQHLPYLRRPARRRRSC